MFEAFDASLKDDFEGVPLFTPFQRKKPYECSKCESLFKHKMDYVRHQSPHWREALPVCPVQEDIQAQL